MKRFLLFILFTLLIAQPALASSSVFDGSASRIVISSNSQWDGTSWSVGCWVYRTGAGENNEGHIFQRGALGVHNARRLYYASSTLVFRMAWSTNDGVWTIPDPGTNTWYRIDVSYDSTSASNDPLMYLNGVSQSVTKASTPSGSLGDIGGDIYIGDTSNSVRSWAGNIANCSYYNRILAANEFKQITRSGPQSLSNGRKCYYPLGIFNARNYTANPCGTGTETSITVGTNGPPTNAPQGSSRGLRWR